MATTTPAVVTQVTGRAFIRNADGSLTELHVGSHVPPNSEVVTASGSTVALQVDGGMPLLIGENRDVAFNGEVAGNAPVDPQEAALAAPTGTDSDRLLAALQNGQDPFDNLDPTAALVAGGGDAGGSSFVRLARILETTSPLGLAYPNDSPAAFNNLISGAGVANNNNNATNDAPLAGDDSNTTTEKSLVSGNILTNDTDPNGDALAIVSVGDRPMTTGGVSVAGSTGGTFTVFPDGSYVFNPGDGYHNLGAGQSTTSSATYTVTDPSGATSTATVTVTVNGLNDAPTSTAIANVNGVDAEKGVNVDVSSHFTDVDNGDKLTFTATGLPPGLVIDPATGKITGTIDHSASQGGDHGHYQVVVIATDTSGATTTQTFDWNVTNPGPTATNDAGATHEGATLIVSDPAQGVLGNDVDPDGDTLTVTHVTGREGAEGDAGASIAGTNGGVFTVNGNGTYTFVPDESFDHLGVGQTATTSVTYTVSDGEGGTSTATLTVTVTGTNDIPVLTGEATNQEGIDAGAVKGVDMSQYFHDVDDGDKLTYSAEGLPKGLNIDPNTGVITGTIDHSASVNGTEGSGTYTITVTANDGHGGTAQQTFTWDITNPAPTANNDSSATEQNGTTSGNVITGAGDTQGKGVDTDPDGDKLTVDQVNGDHAGVGQAIAGTEGGSFTINADGSYTFNAGHDFDTLGVGQTKTTSVDYLVTDSEGGTSKATLTVTVTGTNDGPTSTPFDAHQSGHDAQGDINVDVSSHFSDIDNGDTLTFKANGLPPGLTMDDKGVITGTIDHSASQGGDHGVYAVVITATDGSGVQTQQTLTWDVTNPVPTATNDSGATVQDGSTSGNVITGAGDTQGKGVDTDPDGDKLTVDQVNGDHAGVGQAIAGTEGGSFTINADGSYTFNAGHDFDTLGVGQTKTTSIDYLVTDSEGGTSKATLTVTVTGTNDGPTSTPFDAHQSGHDAQGDINVDVSSHFSDIDNGDTLTFKANGLPPGLTMDDKGVITGTIDHSASQGGDHGVYAVVITATDGSGVQTQQTLTWDVTNPVPTATNDSGATVQDGSTSGNVITGAGDTQGKGVDTDPDGDKLTVDQVNGDHAGVGQAIAGTEGGSFTINADGSYTFNAGHDFDTLGVGQTKTTSIDYLVTDSEGGTSKATLTVTVTGTNDGPTSTPFDAHQSGHDAQGDINVDVSSHFSDIDNGDTLTFKANGLPPGLTMDDKGVITGTIDHSASQGGDHGVYAVVITATDGSGVQTQQTLTWDVTNPVPTATNDSGATVQDGSTSGNVITGAGDTQGKGVDTDPDGDKLTVDQVNGDHANVGQAIAGTEGGSFTINADGSYTFNAGHAFDSLAAGKTQTTSIDYLVTDSEGGTSKATLTVTVTGTNDGPSAVADNNASAAGGSTTGNVITGLNDTHGSGVDSDIDGDKLTVSQVNGQANQVGQAVAGSNGGTFTINADGSYTFNAGHDFDSLANGTSKTTTVQYQVSDGEGGFATTSLTVEVTGTNHAPTSTALDNQTGLDHDTVNLDLSGHFKDVDAGDKLTYTVSGLPTGLSINPNTGVITGTIDHSASQHGTNGSYHITITATDSHGAATSQSFDWKIGNTIPVANPDTGNTLQGGSVTGDVINGSVVASRDTDADTDPLHVSLVNGDAGKVGQAIAGDNGGTFTLNANGTYTFNAGHDFDSLAKDATQTTQIHYTVSDGEGGTSETTLTITVTGTNDVPVITGQGGNGVGDVGTAIEDFQNASGQLVITDKDTGENHVQAFSKTDAYGTFSIDANGKWTYTLDNSNPAVQALSSGQSLPDRTFTVTSQDGSATHTVTVHVNGTDDAPTAVDNATTVNVGQTHTFTTGEFNFADSHGEHDSLQSVIITHLPDNGSLTLNGVAVTLNQAISASDIDAGKLVFTPASSNAHDTDFGFKVVDSGNTSNGGQNTSTDHTFTINTGNITVGTNDGTPISGGHGDDVLVGDQGGVKTTTTPGQNYNIALIVDHSGSMSDSIDGTTRIALVKAALLQFVAQLSTHDGVINLTLIGFGSSADNAITIQGLNPNDVDQSTDKIIKAINALQASGSTNYEDAFDSATSWFASQATAHKGTADGYQNLSFFMTDGDPTVSNEHGTGNSTTQAVLQDSVDAYKDLSNVSTVYGIGIGDGVNTNILQFFDNTNVTGQQTIVFGTKNADLSGDSGFDSTNHWTMNSNGDTGGTITANSNAGWFSSDTDTSLTITDRYGNSGNAAKGTIFDSNAITVADGTTAHFTFDLSSSIKNGDSFGWALQELVNGAWTNVQTGSATGNNITTQEVDGGQYRFEFTLTDNTNNNKTASITIDDFHMITPDGVTANIGQVDIVHQASDLQAALNGGGTHTDPAAVGNDTINGGDGNDIIFGDTINTDSLAWAGHAAGSHNGAGMQGLIDYLTATNGHAPTSTDLYNYIGSHSDQFNVAGDTRGGNDTIHGGAGNDIIYGQGGNDVIVGGQGNDTLYGGEGSDTFRWELNDQGTKDAPAVDTIKDFNPAAAASGGDVLDLNQLLHNPADASLSQYLHFSKVGGNTEIQVSTAGDVAHGFDQKIILTGVDLTNNGASTDQAIINDLLTKGKLQGHHN